MLLFKIGGEAYGSVRAGHARPLLWVAKGKQSATGRNPSGAAAPPPFDKGGRGAEGSSPLPAM